MHEFFQEMPQLQTADQYKAPQENDIKHKQIHITRKQLKKHNQHNPHISCQLQQNYNKQQQNQRLRMDNSRSPWNGLNKLTVEFFALDFTVAKNLIMMFILVDISL